MKKLILLVLCVFGLSSTVLAANSPETMLEGTANQMISALKTNSAKLQKDPSYAESLARQILLPKVDVPTMSRLALGRNAWKSATPSQRRQFMDQFTTMMIRTYSSAFAAYTNEKVKFYPIRGGVGDRKRVQVKSVIIQPGGPSIPVNYRLLKRDSGWKVYDITVDGVSMVQSFRSQFANEIATGGMNGLLAAMKKHNSVR